MRRAAIPNSIKLQVLYESAFCCVVCQEPGIHIHHIDKDHSNNDPANLISLCQKHHDDAHTQRELTQNLSPQRLREFRAIWTRRVQEKRDSIVTVKGQRVAAHEFFRGGVAWGYINHSRVSQMLTADILHEPAPALWARCLEHRIVDQSGIIIKPTGRALGDHLLGNTIYDWFPYGDDHALHSLYSKFVDAIATRVRPVHLGEDTWSRTFIRNMVSEGDFIFINRGQYFTRVAENSENAHILVKTFKRHIRIEYYVDTRDMFGTTSIVVSFSGHKRAAALLLVKSITQEERDLVLHCTPIGLGVGFQPVLSDLATT